MSPLEEALKNLINRRGLSQTDIAKATGLSATAISNIMRGVSVPRRTTMSRLMDVLCRSDQDRNYLNAAYEGRSIAFPEEMNRNRDSCIRELVSKGTYYLETKAAAIDFRNRIERIIQGGDISFRRDPVFQIGDMGMISVDFLLEADDVAIAVESKSNVSRDWGRSLGQCIVLRDILELTDIILCVPYIPDDATDLNEEFIQNNIEITPINQLPSVIKAKIKKLKGDHEAESP